MVGSVVLRAMRKFQFFICVDGKTVYSTCNILDAMVSWELECANNRSACSIGLYGFYMGNPIHGRVLTQMMGGL